MAYAVHGCSSAVHHPSATVFSGENCSIMNSNVGSMKRKSLSPLSSPSQISPKRVTLNSPPPSASASAAAIASIEAATEEGGSVSILPIASSSPKWVSEKSTTAVAAIAAATEEGGSDSISPAASPSSKRVSEKSPSPTTTTSTAAAISAASEGGSDSISPTTSLSSKRVSGKTLSSTTTTIVAGDEDCQASISQITTPPPAFSPFSKRVSEKSPFSTTTTTNEATAANPPLPFSRFTNNKNLRRTLSEPPVFDSFTALCHYMKQSQSPENTNNNPISVKSPLIRRSVSDPTAADIVLGTPALTSETTRSKVK
ncbi:hypothetical protein P3S67_002049 [Capsicum chacoense]